jgi:CelD/BcsL family acetyltransferase involved in cellulose biosynthesis
LLRHFGKGNEYLCWLERDGHIEAMCILRRRVWWHWASFLPSQAQISPTLIADASHTDGLVASLPGHVLALDLLCIDPTVSNFPVSTPLAMRWHQALTMAVVLEDGFAAYEQRLSGGLRQNLRRYERRVTSEFERVEHRVLRSPAEITEGVQRYAALESAGWKGQEGTALALGNAQLNFYLELLMGLATGNRAEVHELWLDDKLAASRLVAQGPNMAVMLKTTYDESLARYAPGRILLKRVITDLFERFPGQRAEFYTNATRNQIAWASSLRPIRHVRLFRHGAAMLMLAGVRTLRDIAAYHANAAAALTAEAYDPPDTVPTSPDKALTVAIYDHPDALPDGAKTLLQSAEIRYGIEFSLDWYRLLVEHVFKPPARPQLFVLSRGEDTLAVLPMVLASPNAKELRSLGNFYTSINGLAWQPGIGINALTVLARALREVGAQVTRYDFGPMDPESVEFGLWLAALERSGLVVPFPYFRFGHWTMNTRQLSFQHYLATRSGVLRNTVARMSRRLIKQGGHTEIVTGGERLELALAAYERVYAVSWKQAEPYPEFIRQLVRLCAQRGWLRLGVAWLGETPIAAQCWIVAHGRAAIFKLAYDESFKNLSAGTVLTSRLMEHALDVDHVAEVDYLIGDDAYKRDWMSHRDERWGIVAYDPRSIGGVIDLFRQIGTTVTRRLRQSTSDS